MYDFMIKFTLRFGTDDKDKKAQKKILILHNVLPLCLSYISSAYTPVNWIQLIILLKLE